MRRRREYVSTRRYIKLEDWETQWYCGYDSIEQLGADYLVLMLKGYGSVRKQDK